MTPPSLLLAILVAVLKGLRPANSLEKAVNDFNSLHETSSSAGLATACRYPFAFKFPPTLSPILARKNIRHLLPHGAITLPHYLFSFVAIVVVVVVIIASFMFL